MKAGVVALLALLGLAAGCGDLGGRYEGSQRVAADKVGAQDLERYRRGSPERTVLEWYAALQRNDVETARSFYSARIPGESPARLRIQLAAAAPAVARTGLGPLTSEPGQGGTATVLTDVRVRWETPNGRAQEVRTPQAFTLVREQSGWRFADTYFPQFALAYRPAKPLRSW
jgi:hypothetical protein